MRTSELTVIAVLIVVVAALAFTIAGNLHPATGECITNHGPWVGTCGPQ
jgi:hypothetical protein